MCRGEQPELTSRESFGDLDALCAHGRAYHEQVRPWLAGVSADRLQETVSIPWFNPPLELPVGQALTQAVMHSHDHRGQNATRLRALGGEPGNRPIQVFRKLHITKGVLHIRLMNPRVARVREYLIDASAGHDIAGQENVDAGRIAGPCGGISCGLGDVPVAVEI